MGAKANSAKMRENIVKTMKSSSHTFPQKTQEDFHDLWLKRHEKKPLRAGAGTRHGSSGRVGSEPARKKNAQFSGLPGDPSTRLSDDGLAGL